MILFGLLDEHCRSTHTNPHSVLRFDPDTETFETFELSRPNAAAHQMLVAEGVVWAAESGIDRLLRITLETAP